MGQSYVFISCFRIVHDMPLEKKQDDIRQKLINAKEDEILSINNVNLVKYSENLFSIRSPDNKKDIWVDLTNAEKMIKDPKNAVKIGSFDVVHAIDKSNLRDDFDPNDEWYVEPSDLIDHFKGVCNKTPNKNTETCKVVEKITDEDVNKIPDLWQKCGGKDIWNPKDGVCGNLFSLKGFKHPFNNEF